MTDTKNRDKAADGAFGFVVDTLPCMICNKPEPDTSEYGEDGKKVWYHAACMALKLMEVEDAFAQLAKEKFPGMPLLDLAGKMVRRARKINKPNAKQ
jgi:hypothetical protein